MTINYVSGKTCIGRLYDRFPIDFNGWEVRAAYWISQGLKRLDIPLIVTPETIPGELVEYKCKIPTKTAYIRAISWNGYRIKRIKKINNDPVEDLPILYDSEYWYDLTTDGYIISNLEEGDIKIYVYKYIEEFDAETNVWYPKVPDDEFVLESLDWYLLSRLLQRGHSIKGYSLSDNNKFTNPSLAFEMSLKAARNSINTMSADEYYTISKINRTLLIDYNNYTQGEYNPNYYET